MNPFLISSETLPKSSKSKRTRVRTGRRNTRHAGRALAKPLRREALRPRRTASPSAEENKARIAKRVRSARSRTHRRIVFFPFDKTAWKSKPHLTQREAKGMAKWGIILRPGIERDTLLMPWLIADSVLHEASVFLDVQLPLEWSDWLDQRAERCYASHKQFRRLIRGKGNTGRSYLYAFLRHWLAGKLEKTNRGLFRRLPRSYCLGAPPPSRQTPSPHRPTN